MTALFKKIPGLLCLIVLICSTFLVLGCSNPSSSTSITVMTYNIHHGEGTDGKLDLLRIADIIRNSGCDIAGLQEVDNNFGERSNFVDQAKWLAEELDMHYMYGPAIISGTETEQRLYGNALLSRYPINKSQTHKLYLHPGHEPRVCIEAEIKTSNEDYTIMVTHLDHRSNEVRLKQADDILKIIPQESKKTILMGDFNCRLPNPDTKSDSTQPVAQILERFKDSFIASRIPLNKTSMNRRIDYIFISPDLEFKVIYCDVINDEITSKASDHLPVVAEIAE